MYGEICRTVDYLTGDTWDRTWWSILLRRSKRPRDLIRGLGARRALEKAYHQAWCVATIEGTKIGGIPRWIQGVENMPGRFLCALGSVHPVYEAGGAIRRPFPFTNVAGPFVRGRRVFRCGEEEIPADRLLMWGDVGSLYMFLDKKGAIRWTIQCY